MKFLYAFFLFLIFPILTISNEINKKDGDMPAIVPIKWLKDNINNKKLTIIDLRVYDEYEMGHIKNAVNIPALKNLFNDKLLMPKLDFLKKTLGEAGIDKDSLVVAYDNGDFIWAARFYWILETLGHKNIGILKYGFGKKVEDNLPISTEDSIVKTKEFIPRVDNEKIQTKLSTLISIGKKTIIDGRSSLHYNGKKSRAKRFGHIPTALNYKCTDNYKVTQDGNSIKDFNNLKSIYKDLPKNKDIILYCDGGAEAALNYIVLQELGYKASIYDGSWAEWGNDSTVPITNPSKK